MRRYIITGALGAGKTTVVANLGPEMKTVAEPAREVIAHHRDVTGEPNLDARPELFVERLISRSINDFHSASTSEVTVFDRGLPDCVAYAATCGVDTSLALDAATMHRYESTVFVTAPWEQIYTTDDMRLATFEQAESFYVEVVAAYTQLGYDLIDVPKASVHDRVDFIRAHIPSP